MYYFDHNATTPVAPEVAETLSFALREVYGNASSTHRQGQLARQHLEDARRAIAQKLSVSPNELVITSGGTESNNLAILGLLRNVPGRKHAITTCIEHPSVLEAFRQAEREGVGVTYVESGPDGAVEPEAIARALRPETVLVSVMHANNETGVLQPVAEIGRMVGERRQSGQPIFFHSDGVQAFGRVAVEPRRLGVDLYSISSHKIFGPKGTGGLYARQGTPLARIQFGGRHERERRPGTENVPAAMAFAHAAALCKQDHADAVAALRDSFEAELLQRIPNTVINGANAGRLPNSSNVLFRGISAESLVIALDMRGICVSTGAACSGGSVEPSPVLLAMGLTREEARSSVRFSFGRYNSAQEIAVLLDALADATARLEKRRAS